MADTETTLESWKEIAAYLQRDVTTVRRWEKKEGLPVHRHSHHSRSSVYAFGTEIDAWRASRTAVAEEPPPPRWWARLATPGFALAMLLSLILVGNGVRPEIISAQQRGQTRTMVCAGSDCGSGQLLPDVESLLISAGIDYPPVRKLRTALPAADGPPPYDWLLSPDGSRIAYTPMVSQGNLKNIAPSGEVILVNADGGGSRSVYHGGSPRAWSPDARRVLVVSGDALSQMVWVDTANGSIEKLPPHWNVQRPVVSPDGRYIAFSGGQDRSSIENVILMASNGSQEAVVSPSPAFQVPLGWTPDGKNLLYHQEGGMSSLWSVEFENGKVHGPPVHVPLELGKDARMLGISRSGALFYAAERSSRDVYTASMDPATGRVTSAPMLVPVLRTGSNMAPKWSPDSRRLLFLTRDDGKREHEVHLYSSEPGEEQPIPAEMRTLFVYCWSKDGSAVYGNANGKALQLTRVDFAGHATTLPVSASSGRPPIFQLVSCSGDLAVGRAESGIQVRNLADGSTAEIYRMDRNTGIDAAVISHNGQNVAFITQTLDRGSLSPPSTIHIASSSRGSVRELVVATSPAELQPLGLAWSPDDRFLYFTRRSDRQSPFELLRIPAGGGGAESMGLKIEGLRDIDIAPDGRRVAFSAGSGGTEVWAVQGFLPENK